MSLLNRRRAVRILASVLSVLAVPVVASAQEPPPAPPASAPPGGTAQIVGLPSVRELVADEEYSLVFQANNTRSVPFESVYIRAPSLVATIAAAGHEGPQGWTFQVLDPVHNTVMFAAPSSDAAIRPGGSARFTVAASGKRPTRDRSGIWEVFGRSPVSASGQGFTRLTPSGDGVLTTRHHVLKVSDAQVVRSGNTYSLSALVENKAGVALNTIQLAADCSGPSTPAAIASSAFSLASGASFTAGTQQATMATGSGSENRIVCALTAGNPLSTSIPVSARPKDADGTITISVEAPLTKLRNGATMLVSGRMDCTASMTVGVTLTEGADRAAMPVQVTKGASDGNGCPFTGTLAYRSGVPERADALLEHLLCDALSGATAVLAAQDFCFGATSVRADATFTDPNHPRFTASAELLVDNVLPAITGVTSEGGNTLVAEFSEPMVKLGEGDVDPNGWVVPGATTSGVTLAPDGRKATVTLSGAPAHPLLVHASAPAISGAAQLTDLAGNPLKRGSFEIAFRGTAPAVASATLCTREDEPYPVVDVAFSKSVAGTDDPFHWILRWTLDGEAGTTGFFEVRRNTVDQLVQPYASLRTLDPLASDLPPGDATNVTLSYVYPTTGDQSGRYHDNAGSMVENQDVPVQRTETC